MTKNGLNVDRFTEDNAIIVQILNRALKAHFPKRIPTKLRREILGAFLDALNYRHDFTPTSEGAMPRG